MRALRWQDGLYAFALAVVLAFILWLPVFPSGDGPAHLYFAGALASLMDHAGKQAPYNCFYAVRHLVAPYALHYLALIGLERLVTADVAEKLFVIIVVTNSALGFRFLARCLARASGASIENASAASLWMIPLLITWSLGAGFFNFCFAIGTMFWALGFYTLLPSAAALAAFVLALFVLVFSHPVPLMVLILFLAADLLLLLPSKPTRMAFSYKAAALLLSCAAMLGPLSIADKGHTGASAILSDVQPHWDLLLAIITGQNLGLISGTQPLQVLAQAGLVLIVPGAVWLVTRSLRPLTSAGRLMLIATGFLCCSWLFPRSLNGSFYFPQRMWDIVWPIILATAAGAAIAPRLRSRLAAGAIVLTAVTWMATFPVLTRVARRQALLGAAPLPEHAQGIYIEPEDVVNDWHTGTTYPLYYWAGVRAFAPHHAVLLNSPWMYLTILPIKQVHRGALFYDTLPTEDSEHPFALWQELRGASRYRDEALARAGFILYANPLAREPHPLDEMKPLLREQAFLWNCTAHGFYALCVKR